MTNDKWNRIALFLLGAAVGAGLYGVFSDSDGSDTAVLVLTSLGFLCVALGQRGKANE